MLERIRTAFERERRTTANIAHELRTPVTEFVILAETAQRYPADPEETARRLGELREIGEQMSILDRDAAGARADGVRSRPARDRIHRSRRDGARLLEPPVRFRRPRRVRRSGRRPAPARSCAPTASRSVSCSRTSSVMPWTTPRAATRSAASSRTGASVARSSSPTRRTGSAPRDLDKLVEPFWRASQSREDRSHAGIGLSLASRLAELQELGLSFAVDEGVFRARLSFVAG